MGESEGAEEEVCQLEGGRFGELVEVLDDAGCAHQPRQLEQASYGERC